METESEPYVRLATMRQLHQAVSDLATARSLADTLQAVVDGVVNGIGWELAAVNIVQPDGDLVVAALSGSDAADSLLTGRIGSRTAWERRLAAGEQWGALRFLRHDIARQLETDGIPAWYTPGPEPRFADEWHPEDQLLAPMYESGQAGDLVGVLAVDRPRDGRRPGAWGCEALQMYAAQAATAIANARLRSNMQRALVRLEREQQALRASEESFRQAFEYAPSGMAIAELGGEHHGRVLRANDALCRLLGRSASALRRWSFVDLAHPEDVGVLLRTSAEGGRTELRLRRREKSGESYVWVHLRNSVVADAADGPRFLLTHVEDIEDRKRRELHLAHRASHDALTGLPNSAELRSRLAARLCERPSSRPPTPVESLDAAYGDHRPDAFARHENYESYEEYAAAHYAGEPYGTGAVAPYGPYGGEPPYGTEARQPYEAPSPYTPHPVTDSGGHTYDLGPDAAGRPAAPAGGYETHTHAVAPPPEGLPDNGVKGLAVLFCDLDGFKPINDRYGHHVGDAVLIEVARRLSGGVRDGDTVARLGGDEFVVLADGVGRSDAEDLAVRLRTAITQPIRADGRSVRVGASFGIGWARCGESPEEVLQSADQRMYVEKRSRSRQHRRAI
ncbi:putative diguanylate cyclase domain-containing protein [Streptomyces sp. Tu6071]|uniref:diguanylate cyclase CdgB n=1 Tax=unclassified Streptomyces TaxID=2593676 RepID=UPI00020E622E|nr:MULTISPECIES: diguanylate cyclase CdgB [unclassified Streptomyces]ASY34214.1 GGDEF domain-containing protein [Streptomyces sp. CLI2509]EGJ76502.1 putative diguanylate cyclase domain-containing protein [Streptomyces sp. Tu6071]